MLANILKDKWARILLMIFAIIYFGYLFLPDFYYFGQHDGKMYFQLAMASLEKGAFACWIYQKSHWPPAWVELTAGLYRVFGLHPLVTRIFLMLCAMGIGVLVYKWAEKEFGAVQGRVALVLALTSAFMLKFTTFHQYEIFISFSLLAVAYWIFAIFKNSVLTRRQELMGGVMAGVLMSACVLSSTKTSLIALGFGMVLLIMSWSRKKWIGVTTYTVIGSTVFFAWVARNYHCFDEFIPLTTNGGIVFYMANGPGTDLKAYSNPYHYEDRITPENTKNYDSDKWYQYAKEYIRAHPWLTLKRTAARFILFMNPHYVDQVFAVVLFFLSLFLFICGRYPVSTASPKVWLSIIFLFWILHSFYQYEPRYMLPIWPFLVLFGTGFLSTDWIKNKWPAFKNAA